MPDIRLTGALAAEYVQLYRSCEIRPQHLDRVESAADRVLVNAERYRAVATPLGIPWYFIAALHNLESSQSFERHLHNGDPLTSRTRRVPAGRPADGAPPFTWEGSADDALRMKRLTIRSSSE